MLNKIHLPFPRLLMSCGFMKMKGRPLPRPGEKTIYTHTHTIMYLRRIKVHLWSTALEITDSLVSAGTICPQRSKLPRVWMRRDTRDQVRVRPTGGAEPRRSPLIRAPCTRSRCWRASCWSCALRSPWSSPPRRRQVSVRSSWTRHRQPGTHQWFSNKPFRFCSRQVRWSRRIPRASPPCLLPPHRLTRPHLAVPLPRPRLRRHLRPHFLQLPAPTPRCCLQ